VRITAQLIDAATGTHLWADRFDGPLDDIFELQDQVASSVAGVIEPALQAAETARSSGRPTDDLTAYDLYLRAYSMALSSARQIPQALRLLEQAIERDPHYGPALAYAALGCFLLVRDSRSEDPVADRLRGIDFARRALEVAGDDPIVLANGAVALAWFGEDIGAMTALVDRVLALNPNYARGWQVSGILRMWAGHPDIAIEHVGAALRLSPRGRVGGSLTVIGTSHFYSRRFDEAAPKLLLAIQQDANDPSPYRVLAACYAHIAVPTGVDHLVDEFGVARQDAPVNGTGDGDLAVAGLSHVAQFQDQQVGPCARPDRGDRASTSNTEKAAREPGSSVRIAGDRNRSLSLPHHQLSRVAKADIADRFKWRMISSHLAAPDRLSVSEAPATSAKQSSMPVTGSRTISVNLAKRALWIDYVLCINCVVSRVR
jgi:tetratricopeptide (TPR) repeat protein